MAGKGLNVSLDSAPILSADSAIFICSSRFKGSYMPRRQVVFDQLPYRNVMRT